MYRELLLMTLGHVMDAAGARVNASTLGSMYGETL